MQSATLQTLEERIFSHNFPKHAILDVVYKQTQSTYGGISLSLALPIEPLWLSQLF